MTCPMTCMTTRHPFHDLLPRQAVPLRRRALKLTGNEHRAEDLVQATFLKAWASRDSFRPGTNLSAFYSELRKYRREVEDVHGGYARGLSEEPRQYHGLAFNELISAIALPPRPAPSVARSC